MHFLLILFNTIIMTSYKAPKKVAPEHQEFIKEVGRRLEQIRKNLGFSAMSLSDEIKISRNSLRQMEKGEIYFSTENFLKVLDFYKVPFHIFFHEKFDELLDKGLYSISFREGHRNT